MRAHPFLTHAVALIAGVALLALAGAAAADPPSRVARLGYVTGVVEFSPGGENDWGAAMINRPLMPGDRLWADAQSRAEIQMGGAMVRMGAETAVTVLNLDDRIAQLQLTQGALNVRVRRLDAGQTLEINTPNLAFTLRKPGAFRIEVDPAGDATTITVRQGQGAAYGEGASYVIDSRRPYRFTGRDLREDWRDGRPGSDEFDRWSDERERRYDNSPSSRYVSPDVIGYQDLDDNGTWRVDATYGNVWYPSRVSAGWAPYRDGHWAWVDPWGWTWVDDAPWGFAVSHYGRWANLRGTWGWVPGPVRSRAYYAPALVAFVGGSNFQLSISGGNVGGIAWFPLAPREVYRPSYAVSRGYFENVNRSNTVINTTVINNYYNNTNVTQVVYANREVAGAIVAVPSTVFVQSQPVSRAAVRVSREMVAGAVIAPVASVAPSERSVHGNAGASRKAPPRAFERPVVAHTAPPAAPVGFAAQKPHLADKPGRPLDEAARQSLKPVAPAPAPVVRVVAPTKPVVAPPAGPVETRVAAPEPKRQQQAEPRQAKPEPKPQQQAEPRQAKPEPKPQQQAKPEPKPQQQAEPRQAKPEPKPQQQQQARPEPKPQQQAEPRQARPEPKPQQQQQQQAKPEPKPQQPGQSADKKPKDKGDEKPDDKEKDEHKPKR